VLHDAILQDNLDRLQQQIDPNCTFGVLIHTRGRMVTRSHYSWLQTWPRWGQIEVFSGGVNIGSVLLVHSVGPLSGDTLCWSLHRGWSYAGRSKIIPSGRQV